MPILLIGLGLVLALVATRHRASGSSDGTSPGAGGGGGGAFIACPTPAQVPDVAWVPIGVYQDNKTKKPEDSNGVPWDITATEGLDKTYFARAKARAGMAPYAGQCFAISMPPGTPEADAKALVLQLHQAVEDFAVAHAFSKVT